MFKKIIAIAIILGIGVGMYYFMTSEDVIDFRTFDAQVKYDDGKYYLRLNTPSLLVKWEYNSISGLRTPNTPVPIGGTGWMILHEFVQGEILTLEDPNLSKIEGLVIDIP